MLPAWLAALVAELPDADYFDAHTHIGQNDPDGARSTTSSPVWRAMVRSRS